MVGHSFSPHTAGMFQVLSIYSSTTFNPTFGDSDFLATVLFWMIEFLPSSELILTAPTELFSTLHRKAYFLIYLHRQRTFLTKEYFVRVR
jgi:hypothetical protein